MTGQRDTSTVPGQALHLFNSPFVVSQAEYLQRTCGTPYGDATNDRICTAWQRALGRDPTVK